MLNIMTLNANYYGDQFGPWPIRRELIREAIVQADPDIIALQAVRKDPEKFDGADQATQLANLLSGYDQVVYQPADPHESGITEGSAFISRLEIQGTDYRPLTFIPDLDDPNHRAVLKAVFNVQEGKLLLYNGHFSWISRQAEKNIQEALEYMVPMSGFTLLVGDLNTTPDSVLFKPFREDGFIDAWRELHPGENGYTFMERANLSKRIDYAWLGPELKEHLMAIEIIADQVTDTGARASDHAGLLVTLSLQKPGDGTINPMKEPAP